MEKRSLNIVLFSPYIPKHIGGGEKYFFDVARVLADAGHHVSVAIAGQQQPDAKAIRQKFSDFLGYSLKDIAFIPTPLTTQASAWEKLWWTRQFDVLYYITDGSLFFSLAHKNILHIQVPLVLDKSSFLEQLKLKNWQIKNTNSAFTKHVVEQHWQTHVDVVHYPMVELGEQLPDLVFKKKEKIILNVGRFFSYLHSKRQDVMVEMFTRLRQLYPRETKGWKLVLIGSVEELSYAQKIKELARGTEVEIIHDVNRQQLLEWYQRASIYWHATGFGVNPDQEPQRTEHFGISTVEAMACGAVPVVIKLGGQPEVVGPQLQDLLWLTQEEGVEHTLKVIQDDHFRKECAIIAMNQAKEFSKAKFTERLLKMVES